ncbi:MAG TPA: hypothetical protein VLK27_10545, partial [Chthoniobacterales bacterium]|nr:hypothetical protein [Chthoniobacterales bacterium]
TPENGAEAPQVYARYWGRMVDGKLEGPVNVHAKRKTHHAIFIDGTRVTRWTAGTAPIGATARWRKLVANRRPNVEVQSEPAAAEEVRRGEPEAPAAGPSEKASSAFFPRPRDYGAIRSADAGEEGGRQKEEIATSILDTYQERRPKIDIDDSLRLLAFPPRSLRFR